MSQLTDAALKVAQSQVGKMEDPLGSNWGADVQKWLASVGILEPASYCMAGIYWCFDQVYKGLGLEENPLTKTGSVIHAWFVAYPQHKSINIPDFNPAAGDIFIMNFGNGHGHTGIVEVVNADKSLTTVEFNTDINGSPNGIGVFRRTRHFVPPIVGFLRYP